MTVLQSALRTLARRKWATGVAVVTLGFGVAINTSAFGVVNTLWFRPLPMKAAERLVVLTEKNLKSPGLALVSRQTFEDWREQSRSFEGMEAMRPGSCNLSEATTAGAAPEGVSSGVITFGAVDFLGFRPVAGRTFLPEDAAGGGRAVMLGEKLWRRRYQADPAVVGREVRVDGELRRVVGILPWRFQFIYGGLEALIPMSVEAGTGSRDERGLQVLARRKEGVSLEAAQAEMAALAARVSAASPATNKDWGAVAIPFKQFVYGTAMRMYPLLLAAAGILLLIVCANVSNLLLAQAAARRKEMAIRAALGARRWSIVRQLLCEGMLVAMCGGAVGFLTVVWVHSILVAKFQELSEIRVDVRVFAYSLVVSMLAGLVFSLAPALTAARADLNEALKGAARASAKGGAARLRRGLVAVELALSLVLLAGTGLLVRTAFELRHAEAGFRTERLLTAELTLRGTAYATSAQKVAFVRSVEAAVRQMPGVETVTVTNQLPLWGPAPGARVEVAGSGEGPRTMGARVVMPGYEEALGISMKAGRALSTADAEGAELVAVVNSAFVQSVWRGEVAAAAGQRIRLNGGPWLRVAGVSGDVRQLLNSPAQPEVLLPVAQAAPETIFVLIRMRTDVKTVADGLRRVVASLDASMPVGTPTTMDEMIRDYFPRVMMAGIGGFGLTALLLACLGLYGVVAFFMEMKKREIGIRIALGASRGQVLRMLLLQNLKLALWGSAAGLLGALALGRLLSAFLYQVSAQDPLVLGPVVLVLLLVATAAGYFPAWRAARSEPLEVLRQE